MQNRFLLTLVLLSLVFTLHAQDGWRPGEMEADIYIHQPRDLDVFRSLSLNGESASPDGRVIKAYIIPSERNRLAQSGLDYRIVVADLNKHSRELIDKGEVLGYFNYNSIVALADSLATAYPSICKKILIGTSVTGKQLGVLKISDNAGVNENEPEILFEGGIHGDELMGPELVIRLARDLCKWYGTITPYTDLINSTEIWLYYLVNPDGYVSVSRYNDNGVDINRDCGYMWGGEGFSPSAFSQPESKAVRTLQLSHNPVVFTCYHGGTEVISYPWSYKTESSADAIHINNLASVYSNTSGYSNLGYGQGYNIMYQIFGSTKDNVYGSIGQVGWSIEVTNQKQPPASQISQYYGYNLPAMTEMIRRSGYGVEGTVTDSITGNPVKAQVWVDGFFPVYTDPEVGDYHKFVLPGTHSIKVSANGYKTKIISGVIVPSTGSITTNFQLAPNPGRYAFRVISSEIPYYPTTGSYPDESYTPGILGKPDSINYSLGKAGWIVIDMGDTLLNGPGDDFKVWESGGTPEGYTVYAGTTMDGPWISLGAVIGTHSFDLSAAGITKARYLRVVDDGDGSISIADAGFDLDGIEFLTVPLVPDFTANINTPCPDTPVDFFDNSTGNPTSWLWTFPGGTPGSSTIQNPSNILYSTPGSYNVTLTVSNAFSTETLTKLSFIGAQGLPTTPSEPMGDVDVCMGETSTYTTIGNLSATQFIWSLWPPEAGSISGTWMSCEVTWADAASGNAWLKVKEVNTCGESNYSDSLAITVHTVPVVNLGNDTTLCLPDSILLDAGNPGCVYLWSTGDTTQTIMASAVDTSPLHIWVEVTEPSGCSASDSINLHFVVCDALPELNFMQIYVYPNPSTGTFTVQTGITNGTCRVYNLFGSLVMETRCEPLFTIDLQDEPGGVYFLRIESEQVRGSKKLILKR